MPKSTKKNISSLARLSGEITERATNRTMNPDPEKVGASTAPIEESTKDFLERFLRGCAVQSQVNNLHNRGQDVTQVSDLISKILTKLRNDSKADQVRKHYRKLHKEYLKKGAIFELSEVGVWNNFHTEKAKSISKLLFPSTESVDSTASAVASTERLEIRLNDGPINLRKIPVKKLKTFLEALVDSIDARDIRVTRKQQKTISKLRSELNKESGMRDKEFIRTKYRDLYNPYFCLGEDCLLNDDQVRKAKKIFDLMFGDCSP